MNLPLWITLSRLLGVPFLLYLLSDPTTIQRWWSLGIFLLAATTDWVDGYLARRRNEVTDLGKFLDPLVDKLLIIAPLLCLVGLGSIPAWGVFFIVARELGIAGWRVNQAEIRGANLLGKLKTVAQVTAVALLVAPLPETWRFPSLVMFWIAVLLTGISGLVYVFPRKSAGEVQTS
jgi:CDP-diacylglycerol--glycerol-3-phosphate 3-phosphatidyltransferase